MEWRLLIFILIAFPEPMLGKSKKHRDPSLQINRALHAASQRKFLDYDSNDPKQIMNALKNLPKAGAVNFTDYMISEMKRLAKLKQMYPDKQIQSMPEILMNQNNTAPNPKSRRISEYVLKQIDRAINRDKRHDPHRVLTRKRHHNHDNPNAFIHEMKDIPDLEEMLPEGYLRAHKNDFKKFHSVAGNDVAKLMLQRKEQKPFTGMQYAEMQSMKNVAKRRMPNLKPLNDILKELDQNQGMDSNSRRQSFLPELSKQKFDHVGNSLLYVHDKRILGSHSLPKKKQIHAVYGNLDSLGIKSYPDSIEIRKRKLKKSKKRIADAQYEPELLFNKNHPALNLLFDKKMWLESAKFTKPRHNLVYGNLNNLGVRTGESSRYTLSDFRRSNNNRRPILREPRDVNEESRKVKTNKFNEFQQQKRKVELSSKKKKKSSSINNDIKYILIARTNKNENNPNKKIDSRLVYGNTKNLSIRYENSPYVWLYTDFRKRPQKKKTLTRTKEDNKKASRLVYGNEENYGIRYGKEPFLTAYSDFRKRNDILTMQKNLDRYNTQVHNDEEDSEKVIMSVLEAIQEYNKKYRHGKYGRLSQMVALEPGDLNARKKKYRPLKYYLDDEIDDNENGANEVLDFDKDDPQNLRRSKGRHKYMSYERNEEKNKTICSKESSSSSSSDSGSEDKNPGNPYTIFKSKYRQNWPWNHFMDGDHMNISPYGPKFDNVGPTGNELFFGRKWWYFNQDDYKPFR